MVTSSAKEGQGVMCFKNKIEIAKQCSDRVAKRLYRKVLTISEFFHAEIEEIKKL